MDAKQIVEHQRRNRRLTERAKTIVAELRDLVRIGHDHEDRINDAADVIEFLQERLARLQRDYNDEIREGQRAAAAAYTEGRHDGLAERDPW